MKFENLTKKKLAPTYDLYIHIYMYTCIYTYEKMFMKNISTVQKYISTKIKTKPFFVQNNFSFLGQEQFFGFRQYFT